MNLLTVENLTKSFGEKLLFENISFGIEVGQKVALIARNGAGKSTLIRILAGEEIADEGKITMGNDITISYLPQNPEMDEDQSVLDYLFDSDNALVTLIKQYEELIAQKTVNQQLLGQVINRIDELHAWDFEAKIKEILGKFDINDLNQKIGALSGGMRKKVALSKALIEEANFIILDEPTNHLDITMIEWLENYLDRQNLSLFIVTHDRYFLDKVCNVIIELDGGNIYRYKGNYAYFLEKKAERLAVEMAELEKARSLYNTELEWMRRQPQARATKPKAREDAFYDLEEKAKQKSKVETREFNVNMQRLGGKILELNYISKKYGGQKILEDFTYTFNRGDRIGIVGKNGCGKSTLLRIIMGEIKPDKGKIVRGQTVEFGYFQQEGLPINEDKRIIDIVKEIGEQIEIKKGSMSPVQFLSYFNFHPDVHYNYFSKLSGGEKRKLYLLTVLLRNPNFLILDEPTNDLDIETLNKLEEFLLNYEGCLLIVSHDRYFMDHIVDHVFVFQGDGKVKDYYGNYSEFYRQWKIEENRQRKKNTKDKPIKKPDNRGKKLTNKPTYKQVKEYETLEDEIAQLELRKSNLIDKMNQGEGTHEDYRIWSEEVGEIVRIIDQKTDRWLELSEIIERVE
ncbi:MAG TPA: ABC-F family ATP-binding cassette domain-containing protein [Bacteroidales bacterium]|nr:ABC-F family ATP-binding cassette domain-containing protein [Bacteroidales bacterium]